MNLIASLTVAERLALTLGGLCRAVAARIAGGALAAAVIVVIWGRIKRAEVRFQGMLTRFLAGRLRVRARVAVAGARAERPAVVRSRGGLTLPRRLGWLLPLVPCEAACFAGQLRVLLGEAEVTALLAASPQARRVMRPLCRMLGIEAELLGPVVVRAVRERGGRVARAPRERPVVERGRPLPRGVLAAARRQGFGKL